MSQNKPDMCWIGRIAVLTALSLLVYGLVWFTMIAVRATRLANITALAIQIAVVSLSATVQLAFPLRLATLAAVLVGSAAVALLGMFVVPNSTIDGYPIGSQAVKSFLVSIAADTSGLLTLSVKTQRRFRRFFCCRRRNQRP